MSRVMLYHEVLTQMHREEDAAMRQTLWERAVAIILDARAAGEKAATVQWTPFKQPSTLVEATKRGKDRRIGRMGI